MNSARFGLGNIQFSSDGEKWQQLSLIKCKNKLEDILNGRSDE